MHIRGQGHSNSETAFIFIQSYIREITVFLLSGVTLAPLGIDIAIKLVVADVSHIGL